MHNGAKRLRNSSSILFTAKPKLASYDIKKHPTFPHDSSLACMLGSRFIGRVINNGITLLIEFSTIEKPKIFSKMLNILWVTSVWVNWLRVLLTTELPAQHRGPSVWQVSFWLLWRPKPRPPWWLQALPLPVHWDITTVRSQTNAQTHLQYNMED